MSTISAISTADRTRVMAETSGTSTTPTRLPTKALGQNDFLKLLATQFQKQDPMKPMDDTAFLAQMAQFTALEQSSNLAKDMALLRSDQQRVTATSYLGRHLTVDAGNGETVTGDVTAIDNTATAPQLVIGEKSFPLSAVLRVEPATSTNPNPQPASSGGI
jgi:flagellar basal-body rod modification protein FlgD